MKKLYSFLIIALFWRIAYTQNVGVGTSSPQQKLEVAGWVELGNESEGSTGTAGSIRYHTTGKIQFYNGSAWVDLLSGNNTGDFIKNQLSSAQTADFWINGSGGVGSIRFRELAANGTNYIAVKSPDLLSADYTFTLPGSYGTSNQVLITNGAGTMSWANAYSLLGSDADANDGVAVGYSSNLDIDVNANNGLSLNSDNIQFGGALIQNTTITQGSYNLIYNLSGTGDFDVQDNGSSAFFVRDDGNVGIGTNAPGTKLEVAGQVKITGGSPASGKVLTSDANGLATWEKEGKGEFYSGSVTAGNWYRIASNAGDRANAMFTLRDYISSGGHSTLQFRAGTSYNQTSGISFTVLNHNRYGSVTFTKVRILTATTYDPQYLEVYSNRTGSVDFSITDNLQSSGWTAVNWTAGSIPGGYTANEYETDNLFVVADNDDRFTINRGGNVGIGITNPAYTMETVSGGTISVNDGYIRNVKGFYLKDWDDDSGGADNTYRLLGRDGAFQFYNGGVVVGNYNDGTWTDLADGELIVEGNAGIGVTSPSQKLHVAGNALVTGDVYVNASTNSTIHYGTTGQLGGTTSWTPDGSNSGLWVEASASGSESGGIFMNGNTVAIWSPGDNDILKVYDEDNFTQGSLFTVKNAGEVDIPLGWLNVGGATATSTTRYGVFETTWNGTISFDYDGYQYYTI